MRSVLDPYKVVWSEYSIIRKLVFVLVFNILVVRNQMGLGHNRENDEECDEDCVREGL